MGVTTLSLGMILSGASASAAVIAVGLAAFPTGSGLITFDGLATGTEVNGLTVGGLQFNYSLGNGMVIINGGPGITNNITPPNVVSIIAKNTGVLTLTLPSPASLFGYGYAIFNTAPVTNATTISLFSGATPEGTLSYNAAPDPLFAGGFAGIQSTIPFDRVALTFNSLASPAFALDNVRIATGVPEPSTLLLVLAGAIVVLRRRRT